MSEQRSKPKTLPAPADGEGVQDLHPFPSGSNGGVPSPSVVKTLGRANGKAANQDDKESAGALRRQQQKDDFTLKKYAAAAEMRKHADQVQLQREQAQLQARREDADRASSERLATREIEARREASKARHFTRRLGMGLFSLVVCAAVGAGTWLCLQGDGTTGATLIGSVIGTSAVLVGAVGRRKDDEDGSRQE